MNTGIIYSYTKTSFHPRWWKFDENPRQESKKQSVEMRLWKRREMRPNRRERGRFSFSSAHFVATFTRGVWYGWHRMGREIEREVEEANYPPGIN